MEAVRQQAARLACVRAGNLHLFAHNRIVDQLPATSIYDLANYPPVPCSQVQAAGAGGQAAHRHPGQEQLPAGAPGAGVWCGCGRLGPSWLVQQPCMGRFSISPCSSRCSCAVPARLTPCRYPAHLQEKAGLERELKMARSQAEKLTKNMDKVGGCCAECASEAWDPARAGTAIAGHLRPRGLRTA